jgi:hypothetical protein
MKRITIDTMVWLQTIKSKLNSTVYMGTIATYMTIRSVLVEL